MVFCAGRWPYRCRLVRGLQGCSRSALSSRLPPRHLRSADSPPAHTVAGSAALTDEASVLNMRPPALSNGLASEVSHHHASLSLLGTPKSAARVSVKRTRFLGVLWALRLFRWRVAGVEGVVPFAVPVVAGEDAVGFEGAHLGVWDLHAEGV